MAALASAAVGFVDWKLRQMLRKSRLGKIGGAIKKRLKLTGWDKYIPGFGEDKKPHREELTKELQKDFPDDFLSACEAVSDRLLTLKKRYPDQPLYSEEEFAETKTQFDNKQILISVLGCHNSGKSTLLNALLDCELLPVSTTNETAVKIHIQNHEAMDSAAKRACPRLIVTRDGRVTKEVEGVEAIHSELLKLNESARGSEMLETKSSQYRILMSVPLLGDVLPKWNVSLVDTPGFGEDNAKVSAAANAAMSASSACVYVTNSGSLGSQADTDCFAELDRHDVIDNGRLIIAVTKFDENYKVTSGKVLDEEEAKKRVASCLKVIKRSIPLDRIFVVSGLWANMAQELRNGNPVSIERHLLKMTAVVEVGKHPGERRGQGEGFEHLLQLSPEEIAEKLKNASGILPLEKSIQQMAMKCGETWISKMHSDHQRFLNETKMSLLKRQSKTLKKYNDEDECHVAQMAHYSSLTESQESLEKMATDEESPVHKAIEQAYDEDLQIEKPEVRGKEAANVLLNEFEKKCAGRIKDRNDSFGPEEFQQELQQFCEELQEKLESTFNGSCRFMNVSSTLIDHVDKMVTTFEGMKAYTERFVTEIPNLPKFEEYDIIGDQPDVAPKSTTNLEQLCTATSADTSASSEDQQQVSSQADQPFEDLQQICTADNQQIPCTESESSDSEKPNPTAAKLPQTLDEAMKVQNLGQLKKEIKVPHVTLSYWDQLIDWFRNFFGTTSTETGSQEAENGSSDSHRECDSGTPASIASESHGQKKNKYRYLSDMDEPVSKMKRHIMTVCDRYCKDIKPCVVKYFFNQYRKRTNEKLGQFESEYGDRIAERLIQLRQFEVQLDVLHQEIDDLNVIVHHLGKMIAHLEQKFEVFHMK